MNSICMWHIIFLRITFNIDIFSVTVCFPATKIGIICDLCRTMVNKNRRKSRVLYFYHDSYTGQHRSRHAFYRLQFISLFAFWGIGVQYFTCFYIDVLFFVFRIKYVLKIDIESEHYFFQVECFIYAQVQLGEWFQAFAIEAAVVVIETAAGIPGFHITAFLHIVRRVWRAALLPGVWRLCPSFWGVNRCR